MTQPLMPKATAVWLIENTALSFRQIADFCGLHELEVQSIADDEVAVGMVGFDPITNGQLTQEEIARCTADSDAKLDMAEPSVPIPEVRNKGPRYTPVARRQDRPDAIAWMLRNFPELSDGQISRLLGTTKPTISSVRERTHWNIASIKPRDPVSLGLCGREELSTAIEKARRAAERVEKRAEKEREKARKKKAAAAEQTATKAAAGPEAPAEPAAGSEASAEPAAGPPSPGSTPEIASEPGSSAGDDAHTPAAPPSEPPASAAPEPTAAEDSAAPPEPPSAPERPGLQPGLTAPAAPAATPAPPPTPDAAAGDTATPDTVTGENAAAVPAEDPAPDEPAGYSRPE